jgi:hypothetical protein
VEGDAVSDKKSENRVGRWGTSCLNMGPGVGLLLLLAACAAAPKVMVDAAEVEQQFKDKTVAQALGETEAAMARAEQKELAFYSPGFFELAQKALAEARFLKLAPKVANEDGISSQTEIFTKLSLANKSITQAEANEAVAQKHLVDILKVRDSLIVKGIDKSAAGEFADLIDSLDALFRRIEKNELDGFGQSQKVTLRQFRRLESQSVKAAQLDQVIALLEQAEAIGARGAAPKSYKKTQRALKNAQAVIERDANNQQAISDAVERFAFEVNHLLHATNEVKELRSLNHAAMENILLAAESRLLAIADALGVPDPRQKKLREQTEMLVNAADKLVASKSAASGQPRIRRVNKNELELAQLHVEQLQAQLRGAQAKSAQLKREQKPLFKRIDVLERVVIRLNSEKAALEGELAKATAPPTGGVEIMPIQ